MMKSLSVIAIGAVIACSHVLAQSSPSAPPERVVPDARTPSRAASMAMTTEDSLASKLIGATIRTPGNENIGDINDLVIDKSGNVKAVIAGIGGFLGLGEHRVMLRYDQMQFIRDSNGRLFVISQLSRDHLKALPAWRDFEAARSK